MANYRGYFNSTQGKKYQVDFITSTSSTYTEITLSADEPFVVNYDTSDGPFDPIRKSQATINVVSNSYLYDIYSSERQHTKVTLTDITNSASTFVEWCGYVQPQMDNQSYERCVESITITASDCISSLQYYDYEKVGQKKQIVTFKQLLDAICNKCGQLDGYEVVMSKKINNAFAVPADFKISEQNFFSSDTDSPWKYIEVLEEICKYLGYTALQWHNRLYLIDYQYLHNHSYFATKYWLKGESYATAHSSTLGGEKTIAKQDITSNGGQISFDTTYDKATVNCSNYFPENIIPDIMGDEAVEVMYRNADTYDRVIREGNHKNEQGQWVYATPAYLNKNNTLTRDTEPEVVNYYNKLYNPKNYVCKHYTPDYTSEVDITDTVNCPDFYITDYGYDYDEQYETTITGVYAVVDIYNLLSDTPKSFNVVGNLCGYGDSTSITIQAFSKATVTLSYDNGGAAISPSGPFVITVNNLSQTVTTNEGANNDSMPVRTSATKWWGGATIIDLARDEGTEIHSSVQWDRYMCIPMKNQPSTFNITSPTALASLKPVLILNNSADMPALITTNETYIAIDGAVTFERYPYRDYIESEWESESSKPSMYPIQTPPSLVFKLKLGNKWWNGTTWTTTNSAFRVPLEMANSGSVWNTEMQILNNISWKKMSGLSGYGIPLSGQNIDSNFEFEMLQPLKLQDGGNDSRHFNGYCWLKNLTITAGNNNSDTAEKNEDVVYENNINSGNCINELDEIDVKITTSNGKLSYSNVGYGNGMLSGITEDSISGTLQKPEENIVQKYVMQYSQNRHKLELAFIMEYTPFIKYNEPLISKYMINGGGTIDYAYGKQEITLIEIN